jgi:AcrR family transcriptional regulator
VQTSANAKAKAVRRTALLSPKATRSDAADRTRASIVAAALKLFATRGVGSVSLREIVVKSGQGNQSAIHYHFKDKAGLVVAVAKHVHRLLQPYIDEAMAEVEAREATGELSNEDLVKALVMPVIQVYHSEIEGPDAVRFITRLASDWGETGQALLLGEATVWLMQIGRRLAARMPNKSREKIWLQILLSLSSAAFGLTALGGLQFSPFGSGQPLYRGKRDESIRDFVHFVSRGVLGD